MRKITSRIVASALAPAIILVDACSDAVWAGSETSQSFAVPGASGFAVSNSWSALKSEVLHLGKPQWRPLLIYVANLHEKSTHPATYPFTYEWEEIGPRYMLAPAFGHWDIIHQVIDVLPAYPTHAYHLAFLQAARVHDSHVEGPQGWLISDNKR